MLFSDNVNRRKTIKEDFFFFFFYEKDVASFDTYLDLMNVFSDDFNHLKKITFGDDFVILSEKYIFITIYFLTLIDMIVNMTM